MLHDKKLKAIELLAEGVLSRVKIAEKVGISRTAFYKWLEDSEFMAEVDRRIQLQKSAAEKNIDARLESAISKLHSIAMDDTHPKQAETLRYLVDRSLGRATTKVSLTTGTDSTHVPEDILDQELEEVDTLDTLDEGTA